MKHINKVVMRCLRRLAGRVSYTSLFPESGAEEKRDPLYASLLNRVHIMRSYLHATKFKEEGINTKKINKIRFDGSHIRKKMYVYEKLYKGYFRKCT